MNKMIFSTEYSTILNVQNIHSLGLLHEATYFTGLKKKKATSTVKTSLAQKCLLLDSGFYVENLDRYQTHAALRMTNHLANNTNQGNCLG